MDPVGILLVDDNPNNLLALEAVLDDPGYSLVRAASGKEALRQLLRQDFAVILLDAQMPEMDGFETAHLIRTREKVRDIPIIFITGQMMDMEHVSQAYALHAVDYLLKPFDPEILRTKVAVLAELYRKTAQLKQQAELLRRSAISRALVGQMLRDLQALGNLAESTMFRAGQEMASRVKAEALPELLDAFAAMGLGTLTLIETDQDRKRLTFHGDGLVEFQAMRGRPTCNYSRGFLCGAVAQSLGSARVAGVELECQSMGDELCRFVVQVVA